MAEIKQEKSLLAFRFLREHAKQYLARSLMRSGRIDELRRKSPLSKILPWQIIRYERVFSPETEREPFLESTFVTPKTFREHLRYLKNECNVVPLDLLIAQIGKQVPVPEKTVAITLDGGWVDHHQFAYPALREFGLPATMFLPTFFVGTPYSMWQNQVTSALLLLREHGRSLPELTILPDEIRTKLADLKSSDSIVNENEISAVVAACTSLRPAARELVFEALSLALEGISWTEPDPMMLSWDDVREMAKDSITFGSLSHGGSPYTEISPQEIVVDIHLSYETLFGQGVDPTRVFAFPAGAVPDGATILLKQLGIQYALAQGYQTIDPQPAEAVVLNRTTMDQTSAPTLEVFACRLWHLQYFGIRF